jgi:hypothetical protein
MGVPFGGGEIMKDLTRESLERSDQELPKYERPQITIMTDEEVLKAFQMTALEISAAGCWWMTGGGSHH